jgi:hypothetical protein
MIDRPSKPEVGKLYEAKKIPKVSREYSMVSSELIVLGLGQNTKNDE